MPSLKTNPLNGWNLACAFLAAWMSKSRELTLKKGALILKQDDTLQCATDSETKLHYDLTRRGLAFAFDRLMTFQQHSAWETYMF